MRFGKTQTLELTIQGMTCGHCVQTVTRALTGVPGVKTAEVDLANARAVVTVARSPDPAALVEAVEAAGYRATPKTA